MSWSSEGFEAYTQALVRRLERRREVVGLVALGSAAGGATRPDRWSDHDLFLIVQPGAQEGFRRDLSWLPDAESLVLAYRETAHGLKALYPDGHLVELAVFDLAELEVARINRCRVLLDRGGVEAVLGQVRARTVESLARQAPDDAWLLGECLTDVLVGAGRWARGERLAGAEMIRQHAVRDLVALLVRHAPAEAPDLADDLDPLRRFERAWPELGEALDALLDAPPLRAAEGLLALLEREIAPRLAGFPRLALAAVRDSVTRAGR